MKKKMIHGSMISISFMLISSLVGYFIKLILTRTIDIADLGLYFSVLGFIMFFVFLRDLGLSESLVYFIPRYLVTNSKKKIKASIKFAVIVQTFNGLVFFFVISLLAKTLATYYFKDERATLLLIGFAFYFILDGLYEVIKVSFYGFHNIFLWETANFVSIITSSTTLIIFILLNAPIEYFGFAFIISGLITNSIFYLIFLKNNFPDFFKIKAKIKKPLIKRHLEYAIPAITGTVSETFYAYQSIFFLTMFTNIANVAYYEISFQIGKLLLLPSRAIGSALKSMIAKLHKKKTIQIAQQIIF